MIHAGVFLLIRIGPLLLQVPDMMVGIALLGLATSLYAWLCGRVQTDVKSALIHATVAQVGLMLIACGLGWFHAGGLASGAACDLACLPVPDGAVITCWVAPSPLLLPRRLRRQTFLLTAALQFWLDRLIRGKLVRPTLALRARCLRARPAVFDRLPVGALRLATRAGDLAMHRGPGQGRRAGCWSGRHCWQRFEDRLVPQDGGGAVQMLQRVGDITPGP